MAENATASRQPKNAQGRPEWLAWAIGSGAFAAFNGVFAKLTTGSSTEAVATWIGLHIFGVPRSRLLEITIRAVQSCNIRS